MCCQLEQTRLADEGQDPGRAIGSALFGRGGDYPKRRCKHCGRRVAFHWYLANHRDGQCSEEPA
jgi:hypothetical protein